jgi:hypothetical protein
VNSSKALFCPVESRMGVAKPPMRPRLAMNWESRRQAKVMLTTVTSDIAPKATG